MKRLDTGARLRLNYACVALLAGTGSLSSGLAMAQIISNVAGQTVLVPADTVIDTGVTASGYAIEASNGGLVSSQGFVTLTTGGALAYAVYANGANTQITLGQGLRITTTGASTSGVESDSGSIIIRPGTAGRGAVIETINNILSPGLMAHVNGTIDADGLTIITSGEASVGARAESGGVITLTNSTVTTNGLRAYGLLATGAGSVINATNLKVVTTGGVVGASSSNGIVSEFGANITVNGNSSVSTSGTSGIGLLSQVGGAANQPDTVLTFNGVAGSSIITRGDHAHGAETCSRTAGSPNCTDPLGTDVAGIGAQAILYLNNTNVQTQGVEAFGVYTFGQSAHLDTQNVNVQTSGANAHAAVVRNGGLFHLASGSLSASGPNAAGLYMSSPAGVTGRANFSNVAVMATQGPAFQIEGGGTAEIDLSSASTATGTAFTATGATSNLMLSGASVWNMTGSSNLSTLTNNASSVLFSAPSGSTTLASSYKTLTVNNYSGQGGTMGLNTYLGADGAPSDRLLINGGAATGTTGLKISNAGGLGALTVGNGIQVVQVANGGTSAQGAFSLASRVVGGPYEYLLYRGTQDASDPQSWYLRSTRIADEQAVSPALVPRYRPEVGAYLANQHGAANMFVHSMHDRLGEPQWIEKQRTGEKDEKRSSGWLRVEFRSSRASHDDGGIQAKTESAMLQGGGDVAQWDIGGPQGRLHLGGMLGYGHLDTKASAADNPNRANGKVEGYNLGVYGTWFQNDEKKLGWYVDGWGSYGWFKNTVNGDQLPSLSYNSSGWAVSGETGYAFKPREGKDWVLEPQAQIIYVKSGHNDVRESIGTNIQDGGSRGWISRLGVRTHAIWEGDDGTRTQPFLTLNWWHENIDSAMAFNQINVPGLYPKDRYEVKLGVHTDLRKGWTGWVNLLHEWGREGYRSLGGRLGAKYTF